METLLTVLVAQYRPDPQALRRTLASLAMQTTRDFAVVLADDGSPQNFFADSQAYLAEHGITAVQTVAMPENGGTVCNILHAAQKVSTRWILTLSPGDYLYDQDTLAWWLQRLQTDAPGWRLPNKPTIRRGWNRPQPRGRLPLTVPLTIPPTTSRM